MGRFARELFRPELFRPWVVSSLFTGSVRPFLFKPQDLSQDMFGHMRDYLDFPSVSLDECRSMCCGGGVGAYADLYWRKTC